MKKITTLLLALVLLLPALALAEEAPAFDFTAEEWLERYKAIVPQEKPFWFGEFNRKYAQNTEYSWMTDDANVMFGPWKEPSNGADFAVSLQANQNDEAIDQISVYCAMLNFQSSFEWYPNELRDKRLAEFYDLCEYVLLTSNPELTMDDVRTLFDGITIASNWDENTAPQLEHSDVIGGLIYRLTGENPAYITLTIKPAQGQ